MTTLIAGEREYGPRITQAQIDEVRQEQGYAGLTPIQKEIMGLEERLDCDYTTYVIENKRSKIDFLELSLMKALKGEDLDRRTATKAIAQGAAVFIGTSYVVNGLYNGLSRLLSLSDAFGEGSINNFTDYQAMAQHMLKPDN
jgi:hypothetical protein